MKFKFNSVRDDIGCAWLEDFPIGARRKKIRDQLRVQRERMAVRQLPRRELSDREKFFRQRRADGDTDLGGIRVNDNPTAGIKRRVGKTTWREQKSSEQNGDEQRGEGIHLVH